MPQKRRPPKKRTWRKVFPRPLRFFSGAALNWESRVEEISAEIFIDRERANGNRGKRGNSETTARSIFSFCCHVVPFTSIASLFLQFMPDETTTTSPGYPWNHTITLRLRKVRNFVRNFCVHNFRLFGCSAAFLLLLTIKVITLIKVCFCMEERERRSRRRRVAFTRNRL